MEQKTKVSAEEGKQDITITREFNIPLKLLFMAYTEAEIVAQWMGTKVIELESKRHGSYSFETSDAAGNLAFRAHGVIHELIKDLKIIRTFEMENSPFGIQLEFLEFEALTDATSKLNMRAVYESAAARDKLLQFPFAKGLNMAHNRLEAIINKLT